MDEDQIKDPQSDRKSITEEVHLPEPTMPPVQAAFISLIAVFFLYQVGGSLLTILIFGMDFQNADVNAMRLLTAAGQILLILAPSLIFTKLVYQDVTIIIRFRIPPLKETGLFVLGLVIMIPLLESYLTLQEYVLNILAEHSGLFDSIKNFLDTVDKFVEQTYFELINPNNAFEMVLIVLIVSVVPAVCEEIFFRGFVLRSFEYKYKPIVAALITALFFGIYHFNPYGLIALIILGTYLGYATYKSNSIAVPMILHFINNFVAVTAFFIFGSEDFMEPSELGPENLPMVIAGFIILVIIFTGFIFAVNRYYNNVRSVNNDMP